MTKELEAIRKLGELHDALVADGIVIPFAYKRRDPKEPGRAEKELAEVKLEKLVKRLFAGQKKRLKAWIEMRYFDRIKQSVDDIPPDDILNDPIIIALLVALFITALTGGLDLANADSDDILETDTAQLASVAFVTTYITEWMAGLNETTVNALLSALELFKTTPGMTIADVMALLPFDEVRAQMVAITEITRMYGKAMQLYGEQLAKDFPNVRVIKTWHTNADDRVCKICRPLNGVSVKISKKFVGGLGGKYLHPPGHPRCRCWMSVRTDINKSVELQK